MYVVCLLFYAIGKFLFVSVFVFLFNTQKILRRCSVIDIISV